MGAAYPTLKRGANILCAYGARVPWDKNYPECSSYTGLETRMTTVLEAGATLSRGRRT
jgi:hypothetical protein